MLIPALITTGSLAGLLRAVQQNNKVLWWISKPTASFGFILAALQAPKTLKTTYGRTILAGLVLGAIGDVLLIDGGDTTFQLGLGSFLFGHIAYTAAFYRKGVSWKAISASLIPLIALAKVVVEKLWPSVPQDMKAPLLAYVATITCMVATAIGGVSYAQYPKLQALGAIVFAASDLMVAKEKFVDNNFLNPLIGLPLYYAAQHMIAATLY